jgi:hypothetical protein
VILNSELQRSDHNPLIDCRHYLINKGTTSTEECLESNWDPASWSLFSSLTTRSLNVQANDVGARMDGRTAPGQWIVLTYLVVRSGGPNLLPFSSWRSLPDS